MSTVISFSSAGSACWSASLPSTIHQRTVIRGLVREDSSQLKMYIDSLLNTIPAAPQVYCKIRRSTPLSSTTPHCARSRAWRRLAIGSCKNGAGATVRYFWQSDGKRPGVLQSYDRRAEVPPPQQYGTPGHPDHHHGQQL